MSVGKIIGLGLAGIIVVLMIYVMTQGGVDTPAASTGHTKQTAKSEIAKPTTPAKSEEEKKLEELQEEAKSMSTVKTSQLYASKCSACHGRAGEGTVLAPSIKGRTKEYLLGKLEDYRQNRVPNTLMKGLLTTATDAELASLTEEISAFK
jgi:cytochrome c553